MVEVRFALSSARTCKVKGPLVGSSLRSNGVYDVEWVSGLEVNPAWISLTS